MKAEEIRQRVAHILKSLPPGVMLEAAAKMRTVEEVEAAIQAGVTIIGQNYVQEAEAMIARLGARAKWHLIGHLQRNKAKKAVDLFDMIETLDSWRLAQALNRHAADMGKIMPVLVEINSGKESSKTGILPEAVDDFVRQLSELSYLRVEGLMTMGPRFGDPEDARPYFRQTRAAFERLKKAHIPNSQMRWLSMGMSNTYEVAIEEGANIVRIGTKLFGEREEEA
jgi:pyridoxal phosphate enzyme (YggS family)